MSSPAAPLIRENFVGDKECRALIGAFSASLDDSNFQSVRRFPNRSEVPAISLRSRISPREFATIEAFRKRSLEELRSYFGISAKTFCNFTLLSEMRHGDSHPLHADSELRNLEGKWVENHTAWRTFTAMLYLNCAGEDFAGGTLRFPSLEVEVVPKAGLLVGFPCGHTFEHEVTPLASGRRYALSLWFTDDESREEGWRE